MYGVQGEMAANRSLWCRRRFRSLGLLALMAITLVLAASCGQDKESSGNSETLTQQAAANGEAVSGGNGLPVSGVSLDLSPGQAKTASLSSAENGRFFCYVEVLTGDRTSIYGYQAPRGCVPSAEFRRGELIVWRFEVLDTSTGKKVTDKEAASVKIRLPDGTIVDAVYKQRGDGRVPNAPWTWDVCWDVPLDYPIGVLDYSIIVTTKDGYSGVWNPPSFVDPSRGIDSRPRIVPLE